MIWPSGFRGISVVFSGCGRRESWLPVDTLTWLLRVLILASMRFNILPATALW